MFSLPPVSPVVLACPAKLNLLLAVTGRRPDGFHELVSVVAPVEFGDTLTVEPADDFSLVCDDAALPVDGTNLVLKAAQAFRAATGWQGGARFSLVKNIPVGAGLGGGSSDAATALKALNRLAGGLLAPAALTQVAAEVGSDCPLFLPGGPVVMRGRGERVEPLPAAAASRLKGRPVLIFKPGFPVATPWAFAQLAARSRRGYRPGAEAESRLANYLYLVSSGAAGDGELLNDLERVVFAKFVALSVLREQLRGQFGLAPRLSGSGSACFALLPEGAPVGVIAAAVRAAWGPSAFVRATQLA
ncbi:MAG: 4-diphosphocytidyl-2-C-methyl-D-erythritol kinase [Verrucomicrobia bacterium]|nr:MAG: 4-diphosphocytidyl-2-C-methyl-D-erythritol kinase [Verrucomicrobiota bacterium]